MTVFRAACIQMRSGVETAANVDASLSLIEEAAREGARFIATPEMTTAVDRQAGRLLAGLPEGEDEAILARYAAAAKAHNAWLLIGSMPVKVSDERAANRSFLFDPSGAVAARYDKIHMFDVDLDTGESWRESKVYKPGGAAVLADTDFGPLGLSICYDLRFPALYRRLAQAGALTLAVPAAFTKPTGRAHWSALLRARAIENGAFVVAPAQGGVHEDGRETYGHSMIVGPWGDVLAEAPDDAPGVIIAEIDTDKARAARAQVPNLALETDFDVVRPGS